jgi:hypothetical protein
MLTSHCHFLGANCRFHCHCTTYSCNYGHIDRSLIRCCYRSRSQGQSWIHYCRSAKHKRLGTSNSAIHLLSRQCVCFRSRMHLKGCLQRQLPHLRPVSRSHPKQKLTLLITLVLCTGARPRFTQESRLGQSGASQRQPQPLEA